MALQLPSVLLANAVGEMSKLPGIGNKTALRLVLHLLRQEESQVDALAESLTTLRRDVKYCQVCHNISDTDTCGICCDARRDAGLVCVVENIQDVMAFENTHQYTGLYHVLGGVISPMNGISPSDLNIQSLIDRVESGGVREVILGLSPTMEGDATNFFIFRKLADKGVTISVIARGVAQNDELQYADEVTLGRSIVNRTPFRS